MAGENLDRCYEVVLKLVKDAGKVYTILNINAITVQSSTDNINYYLISIFVVSVVLGR